jgi:hypothetical protein
MSAFGQRTFSTAIVMSALQFDCEKPLQPAFEETALVYGTNTLHAILVVRSTHWQSFLSLKTNHYLT